MKSRSKYFVVFVPLVTAIFFSCNETKHDAQFQCNCSQIGIDSAWADSNAVSCYKVPVRQVYNNDSSGSILLAVAVAKASKANSKEPLLYLHGGPGIATLGNVKRYVNSPAWKLLREEHDVIFFDYRGTGFSQPDLCSNLMDSLTTFFKSNPSMEDYFKKEIEVFRECRSVLTSKGVDLESFTSHQIAADAEAIRAALNIEKWNVYGVSYGTFIALKYVKHFPAHLNNLVLDSPFPPNTPWLDFVRPMNAALAQLQKHVIEDSAAAIIFPDIESDFGKAILRLNRKPLMIDKLNYYGDEFAWSVQRAMLNPSAIPVIPLVIKEVANGNDSVLTLWKQKSGTVESFGKYSAAQEIAMLCYETRPQKPGDSADSLAKKYPNLVSFNLGFKEQLCDVFRPEKPGKEYFEPVVSDLPILIIGGEFDPVTPPYFGEIASKSLSNSQLLIVSGASHAALHFNACTMNRVSQFFVNPFQKSANDCNNETRKTVFAVADLEYHLRK